MAEVVGERVAARIEELGLTRSEVAKRTGMSQPSITRLITGATRETGKLFELANALETSAEYLIGRSSDSTPSGLQDRRLPFKGEQRVLDRGDEVYIPQIDLRYGMGGTFLDQPVESETFSFSRAWLRYFTDVSPEKLRWIRGVGNSMEPTISDGEPLLVQLGALMTVSDLIWVFAYGEIGMIKRLRPRPGPEGCVEVLSDNPSVPSFTAFDGEIHLIGRVLGSMKRY